MVGSGTVQNLYTPVRNGRSSGPGGSAFRRLGAVLAELFPSRITLGEAAKPRPWLRHRWPVPVLYVLAIVAGAVLSLARYVGTPPWKSIYAEDYGIFLVQALAHPWRSVFYSYAGYEQLVPRLIGQLASMLPLHDAAAVFAITGALVASACAAFVFHASAGHVKSPFLRLILALSIMLLPVALHEIANAGVNTSWYLLIALFWALLWRPRSAAGMAVAALLGFASASSNTTAVVFVLLIIVRLIALPRLREQAVSLGWVAGCLVQVPYFLNSTSQSSSRLSHLATPAQTAGYYGHDVLLPAFGWHVSWLLRDWVGRNYGVVITGGLIAIGVAVVLITGTTRVRLFTITAMMFGFLFAAFAGTVTWWVTVNPVKFDFEPGARYTCLPILLITAVAIVAIDTLRDQWRVFAVLALIAVLIMGWVPDFRFSSHRTQAPAWAPMLSQWVATCQHKDEIRFNGSYVNYGTMVIPCAKVRGQ